MSPVKEEAKKLIEKLPDNATWDDIVYELSMKKKLTEVVRDAASELLPPPAEPEL